jgi:hypothetical protein
MNVCMYVYLYVPIHVRVFVYVFVCIYECMHVNYFLFKYSARSITVSNTTCYYKLSFCCYSSLHLFLRMVGLFKVH